MKTVRGDATEASEMGDAVMCTKTDQTFRRGIAAAMAVVACAWGSVSARAMADGAAQAVPAAAEISRLEVIETAPGARVELEADRPVVWTTFRNAEGHLVLELPDAEPAAALTDQSFESGLVAAVRISAGHTGARPTARVVVETREDAEHRLDATANGVRIELVPTAGEPTATVAVAEAEPTPSIPAATVESPAPETEIAELPAAPVALGTADRPVLGPPPTGAPATRLDGIEVVSPTAVRIAGDGDFAYSTFRLENPARFVVDLEGVFNASDRSSVPVGSAQISRVRVSQFRAEPTAVSRVVFDLTEPVVPVVERTGAGLVVRFGEALEGETVQTVAESWGSPAPTVAESPAPAAELAAVPAEAAPATESEPISDVTSYAAATPAAPETVASTIADFEAADVQASNTGSATATSQPLASIEAGQTLTGAKKEYFGEPISMSLKDADVREVLRSFARISGLNVVIQPGVKGTVTVELESVPWDQALDQILKINNLGYELDGNIMRIAPVEVLEREARRAQALQQAQALSIPLRTVVKRLSYSTAGEVAGLLRSGGAGGILSQRGTVIIDGRTNTLIIKELPNYIDTVLAVIDTLDVPEPQVMIESKIIETTKQFSRSLGINWGFDAISDPAHGNTTGLEFPSHGTVDGGVGLLTGGANGFIDLTLGNILDTFTLDARLQAAESEGLVSVLSAPKIATLNNNPASIQSGVQLPIQTVANNTVTVQFVNATLRLDVTPHVTAEGTILMDINVQKREPQLAFVVPGAANAPIATKEARTRVIVRDGGTTVIGGIYKVSTDQGQDRVPGLSNVPLLGHLFKNRRLRNENDELLIFITPRVIKL
jgi:type IV pilus assembly protein PilQ